MTSERVARAAFIQFCLYKRRRVSNCSREYPSFVQTLESMVYRKGSSKTNLGAVSSLCSLMPHRSPYKSSRMRPSWRKRVLIKSCADVSGASPAGLCCETGAEAPEACPGAWSRPQDPASLRGCKSIVEAVDSKQRS